jgi:hypothetical protein
MTLTPQLSREDHSAAKRLTEKCMPETTLIDIMLRLSCGKKRNNNIFTLKKQIDIRKQPGWHNWLARETFNLKAQGSSPWSGDLSFLHS